MKSLSSPFCVLRRFDFGLLLVAFFAGFCLFAATQNSFAAGGTGGGPAPGPTPAIGVELDPTPLFPIFPPPPPGPVLGVPTNGSWNADLSDVWSNSARWLAGSIADGAGATGNFTFNITATRTITIDGAVASRTLGTMNIGDSTGGPSNYTIAASGGGTLTFDNSGLNAQLNETITSGNNTISAPILLNSSLDITNASANNLTLSGGISAGTAGTKTITTSTGTVTVSTIAITDGSGVIAVTQNGPGALTLGTSSNTYSGGTTLAGGKINIGGSGTPLGTGTLTLSGGTLVTTANRASGADLTNNISVTADSAITSTSGAATDAARFSGTLTGTSGTLTLRNDSGATNLFDVIFSGGNNTMSRPIVVDNGASGGTTRLTDFNTTGTTHTYSGVISGNGSYNRSAAAAGNGGSTIFTANNTYTGTTTVNRGTLEINNTNSTSSGRISGTSNVTVVTSSGTLLFSGSSSWTDRINDSATMTLNGGTFDTGGLSEHGATNNTAGIGALTLSASSVINMGSGSSILAFANSSAATWTGTLSIFNWSGTPVVGGGTDQLYFGNDNTGLTSTQLGEINIYSDSGTTLLGAAVILADGEIVPVPEPATWLTGALLVTATVGMSLHRSRRRRVLASL